MLKIKPSKGRLLIAEPSILNDKSFNRSVIFLTEHNNDGTIGFILNKPSEFTIVDLIPDIDCDFVIYNGGPVEQENLYFIHKIPELITDSVHIANNIYWGGNFEKLTALLNNNKIKADDIRFFLGYSGWSQEQLNTELLESSWVVIENKFENLFSVESDEFWKNQLLKFGGEYQIWANAPEDPALN
ncbi:YqgE/AlgH family protein [Lutibacter sp. HS1-25]|uniref:YqgE/AlgH family protein n=1 Tax=Lutibacter sp. HS1-25 TaxID=2485000 RepID=UPI0010126AD5|nr:YqgE/AlgH family protein [Lutibacter sp. HS1-25]RXP57636.1 YqgE/AlgH family protein [Lutibacter sp. HS1-25]